jgi:cytochrome c556
MKNMRITKLLFAAVLVGTALGAHAAPQDPIEARKAVFKEYKKVFGEQMGEVIKGKQPYDKAAFAKLASDMDALAKKPWEHFPAGSDKGKTNSRADIWTKPAEFKKAIDQHQAETAKLVQVAQTGDLAQIKPQFGAVQKTCKSCHDQFKKED